MVIFGAGASYDSWSTRPARKGQRTPYWQDRPPLADELFDPERDEFTEVTTRFPECQPVIPNLQRPASGSVERELERLQTEAQEYPEGLRQLAAIRFYLQVMLWGCESRWRKHTMGITNYKALLNRIQRWRKASERVCLVTFNYDTLLEEAALGPPLRIEVRGLSDYVASDYKIVKLHGSINWAHQVETPLGDLHQRDGFAIARDVINKVADLQISQEFRMITGYPIDKFEGKAQFPALAIPVETKQDYECPKEHLDILRDCIPEVRKLLVIGWRATEKQFLQTLRENLRGRLQVMVVAGEKESATEVIERMRQAGVEAGEFLPASGGFSDFVTHREADDFLRLT